MAVGVVSFSFSMAAQPEPWSLLCWVLAFLTTSRLSLPLQLYSTVHWLVELNCPLFNSSALYYLQTPMRWYGHASTPPQFLPMSGDQDVSLPLSLEWPVWSSSSGNNCHPVQRSLSSGASVYVSIMGFFFSSSHFISQFPPTQFPLITTIRMCHFLPVCITLNGIFGRVKRSKHNTLPFPNLQDYRNLTIRLFSVITRTLIGGVLPLSSQYILQAQPTEQCQKGIVSANTDTRKHCIHFSYTLALLLECSLAKSSLFNGISNSIGYLMSKPSLQKNNRGNI